MYSSSSFNHFQYGNIITEDANNSFITTTTTTTQPHQQNPNTTSHAHQSHPSSSTLFNFPGASSFPDDGELLVNEFLSYQRHHHQHEQELILGHHPTFGAGHELSLQGVAAPETSNKQKTARNKNKRSINVGAAATEKQQTPVTRRRTGKKDRHSKIYTAQGPRDRRMRLSVQVARKFFDLQDMLGFDKASRTIEWLFTKSKAAIKELGDSLPRVKRSNGGGGGASEDVASGGGGGGGGNKSAASTSESEVVSSNKTETKGIGPDDHMHIQPSSNIEMNKNNYSKKEKMKKGKLVSSSSSLTTTKESREKARERARERTKEKMKTRALENPNPNFSKLGHFGSSTINQQEEFIINNNNNNNTHTMLQHQMDSISIIDKILGLSGPGPSHLDQAHHYQHHHEEVSGFERGLHNIRSLSSSSYNTDNNVALLQNPNVSFASISTSNELTSIFMKTQSSQQNPTSISIVGSTRNHPNPNDQNPTSFSSINPFDLYY